MRKTAVKRISPARRLLEVETLEDRACPSLAVQIDYSLDTAGFFSDPARKNVLQLAADTIAAQLNDNLLDITPGGGNTWAATFTHPGTGAPASVNNRTIPANTFLLYAGARPLGGVTNELGEGGPGGFSASGTQAWLDRVS